MAEEGVDHDYSGRPIPSYDELDWDNPGEYEGGRTVYATKDDRWATRVDGRWYLVDENDEPLMDSPIDADQIVQ